MSNSNEFQQSILSELDPKLDFSEASPEEVEGQFEAAVFELLWNFQEGSGEEDQPSVYARQAVEKVQPVIEQWISYIQEEIEAIAGLGLPDEQKFAALEVRLMSLYDELNSTEFSEILGESLLAAELLGRYEIIRNS